MATTPFTTFPLFPRFPLEIRRSIWREALLAPLTPSYHTENCVTRLDPRAWNFSEKPVDRDVPFLHILPFCLGPNGSERVKALQDMEARFERMFGTRQHELAHERNPNINTPINTNTTNPEFVSEEYKKYITKARHAHLWASYRSDAMTYFTSSWEFYPAQDDYDDKYDAGQLVKPVVDNIAASCREAREEMLLLKQRLGDPRGWVDLRGERQGGIVGFRNTKMPMQNGAIHLHSHLIPINDLSVSLSLDDWQVDETGRRVRGPWLMPATLAHVEEMVTVWTPGMCDHGFLKALGPSHATDNEACIEFAGRWLEDMLVAHPRLRTLYVYDPYSTPEPPGTSPFHVVRPLRFRGAGASFYQMIPLMQNGWKMWSPRSLGSRGTVVFFTVLFDKCMKQLLKAQEKKMGRKRVVRVVSLGCIPDTELRP